MGKSRKWGRCILSFVLAAGMSSASIPVYAAPLDGGSGSDESNAKLPEITNGHINRFFNDGKSGFSARGLEDFEWFGKQ